MEEEESTPRPPRACSADLYKFTHLRSQLVVRQAGAPLCGKARFRESQDAVRDFVACYGAVLGKDLQFTPVVLPEDARWGDDGLIGEWCAVGGHFETLYWDLKGDLRKLDPEGVDGRLKADPWDWFFRNSDDDPVRGRARAKRFVIWNSTPWAAEAHERNPLKWMFHTVPGAKELLKDLVQESLAALGLPHKVVTFGVEVRRLRGSPISGFLFSL